MAEENNNQNPEEISWEVPEYRKPARGKGWYAIAGILAVIFLGYSLFIQNFLFAILIVLAVIVVVLNESREAIKVKVKLTPEGVHIGRNFYDYDDLENFSIIYKPDDEIKNLYFEFNNTLKQRLSINLEDRNPVKIRNFLSQYLEEDTDRSNPPLSEKLAGLFKL